MLALLALDKYNPVSIYYTPPRDLENVVPRSLSDLSPCRAFVIRQQQSAFNSSTVWIHLRGEIRCTLVKLCNSSVSVRSEKLSRGISIRRQLIPRDSSSARQTKERGSSDPREPCRDNTVSGATSSRIVLSAGGWIRPDHGHSRHGTFAFSLR